MCVCMCACVSADIRVDKREGTGVCLPSFLCSFSPVRASALFYQQTCVVLRFYPEFSVCLPQCEYMCVARSKGRVGVCIDMGIRSLCVSLI